MEQFLTDPEFFWAFVVHVSVAIFCGGIIGAERQLRGKPAGMRVCMLVVITTAFFITIATEVVSEGESAVRVMSSIITGVGFLGGGVIFSQSGRVQGITTASLIWVLAAIGMTIGFGYPTVAFLGTLVIIFVLALVDLVEWQFPRLRKEHTTRKEELR